MYIDSHVHARDWEEKHKETIAHALRVAEDSGLAGIFIEPNTKRPITTLRRVEDTIFEINLARSKVFAGILVGLTADRAQVEEAARIAQITFPYRVESVPDWAVVGLKAYLGESVGNLAVVEYEKQEAIYSWLAEFGYEGVVQNHCEKKSLIRPDLFDPKNPVSHSLARPEESEVESVRDLIRILEKTGFARLGEKGRVQVEHVSVPESLRLIREARARFNIGAAVTPHHLLIDTDYIEREGHRGILYKVNPPIRSSQTRRELLKEFLAGRIEILSTDHAPHTLHEKRSDYMSGIPNLASWDIFIPLLINAGATYGLLDLVARDNVNRIYGTDIFERDREVRPLVHLDDYAFRPYARVR